MFIGHFAPAFLARAATQETPRLGTLFIGAQLIDWAFFTFAMFGVERLRIVPGITVMNDMDLYYMPYTHSLLGCMVWALAFALLVWRFSKSTTAAAWAAVVVLAHWLFDFLVHRPDLTLAGSPPKLGLGLWNHPWTEIPLELGLTLIAFLLYVRRTKGPLIPPLVLIGVMLLFQAINWLGPQPTDEGVGMYLTALLAFAVMTAVAYWVDTTRWHKNRVGLSVPLSYR